MSYQPVNRYAAVSRVPHRSALLCAGSSISSIMRNPHSTCRARRCAHYMAEQRWRRENGRIRFMPHQPVNRCAAVSPRCIGRPRPVRKPRNLDNAESLLDAPPRRCAHCSTEQRWGKEKCCIDSCRAAGNPMRRRVPRAASVGLALRGKCVGAVRWRKGLFRCLQ